MKAGKILVGVLVAIGVVAVLSVIIVKEGNQAIILQFGDPKRIIMKPGLNFKIPFIQNVVYLDKRILNKKLPASLITQNTEKSMLTIFSSPVNIKLSCGTSATPPPVENHCLLQI